MERELKAFMVITRKELNDLPKEDLINLILGLKTDLVKIDNAEAARIVALQRMDATGKLEADRLEKIKMRSEILRLSNDDLAKPLLVGLSFLFSDHDFIGYQHIIERGLQRLESSSPTIVSEVRQAYESMAYPILELGTLLSNRDYLEEYNPQDIVKSIYNCLLFRSRERVLFNIGSLKGVLGKSKLLKLVLLNLITNALRHSKDIVTITHDAENHFIDVTDLGQGVDPDDVPFIFDLFYSTKNSRYKNSGVGLYMCRLLLNLAGCDLKYIPLEKGSCFRISGNLL